MMSNSPGSTMRFMSRDGADFIANIKLDNFVARDLTGVGHCHRHIQRSVRRDCRGRQFWLRNIKCGVADTIPERIKRAGIIKCITAARRWLMVGLK